MSGGQHLICQKFEAIEHVIFINKNKLHCDYRSNACLCCIVIYTPMQYSGESESRISYLHP